MILLKKFFFYPCQFKHTGLRLVDLLKIVYVFTDELHVKEEEEMLVQDEGEKNYFTCDCMLYFGFRLFVHKSFLLSHLL